MGRLNNFLHDEEIYPLSDDTLPIFVDKLNGYFLVLAIKRFGALFLTAHDIFQFSALYYQVEDTFCTTMFHMHMYRFMFIREEIEDKSEIVQIIGKEDNLVNCV